MEINFQLIAREVIIMSKDIIEGNWKEIKGKLRQQWGKLTDNEVTTMKGTFEELSGKLQKAYGYKKEQAKKEIDAFLEKNHYLEKHDLD